MNQSREEIQELIKSIGKYELLEENCQGMNAYAFKAKHIPLNRDVFLKIYDACPERVDIFEEPRFLMEATREGTNGNPYLINVLDAEKLSDDWVLVAMELVDGGSILDTIKQGPLALMDAINVTKGILLGLSYLHTMLLVHRDIKPANVMLTYVNGRLHPKLGDFGSVARLDHPDATVTASKHSALYVPPEGWQQPSQYGIRSDIYQVGLVLAEIINGCFPYEEEELLLDREAKSEIKKFGVKTLTQLDDYNRTKVVDGAIARKASKGKLLTLLSIQPYVNRTLKQVINKATHPDVQKRYSSAMDMCNALNSLCFPNWFPSERSYIARNWNNRDWRIEPVNKRSGEEIHIKRSRSGVGKYRRWDTAKNLKEAFNRVLRMK